MHPFKVKFLLKAWLTGADRIHLHRKYWRDARTLAEASTKKWYQSWFDSGTNHREENDMVVCDSKERHEQMYIECGSLVELLALTKHGRISISKSNRQIGINFLLEVNVDEDA